MYDDAMLFWLSVIALSLLASGFIWRAWSLSLGRKNADENTDTHLYEVRIHEIERDLSNGKISETDAETAKAEAARQLIRARQSSPESKLKASRTGGWWIAGALAFVPVATLAVYSETGNPPPVFPQETPSDPGSMSLDQLVGVVEKRLEEFPDDARGWRVVAPVYVRQDRLDKAETAFRNILRIEGPSSGILSDLGEVLVRKAGGEIEPRALALFSRAAELDRRNIAARFYTGLAAYQQGDADRAASVWQALVEEASGDEEWLPDLQARIAEISAPGTGSPQSPKPEIDEGAEAVLALPEDERRDRIVAMVEGLSERLEADPSDREGWARLVRSYMVLGRPQEAGDAVARAAEHFSDDEAFMERLAAIVENFPGNAAGGSE